MELFQKLFEGVFDLHVGNFIMFAVGALLIYLAIKKDYEPMLLIPIGFGAILVNLPLETLWTFNGERGILQIFYDIGIITEIFPALIFIAVGAMIDFSALLKNPKMIFFGAAAQFGIFATVIAALALGQAFGMDIDLPAASAIGIIGAADGPTSIIVAAQFAKQYLGPITVAAYSYMSLVPIIQPPIIRLLTTKKERLIRMDYEEKPVSKTALIVFPVVITLTAGILVPAGAPLIGMLMFGNLLRVCGVVERLSKSAQNELSNLVTLLLGITIGATMRYQEFLRKETLLILALGLVAFIFDTAGGVLFAKLLNLFSRKKVNPMIGAAGISAFPMAGRIVHKMALKEDPTNFLLMHSISANIAGQLGSVVAGGLILNLVPMLLGM
ncbi:MAG TPA: sodium ion-translocating decarboxylase subunit beta [Firmicutes bacterium]|nr:sodium ion-translocating decarboxylase subunit beta [Bacillota bacterium]